MQLIKKGKKLVVTIIVILIVIDIGSFASIAFMYPESVNALTTGIRLSIECILYYFLYKGYKWSKVIICILLNVSGVLSIITGVYLMESTTYLITILLGLLLISIAVTLIRSKAINAFLSYQREKTKPFKAEISDQQEPDISKDN